MDGTPDRRRRRGLVSRLLDLIDNHVTPRADALAIEMGLEITRRPGTRIQTYRSRVWDLRQECGICAGSGFCGARPCLPCDGTGVVTLDSATQPDQPR